VASKEIAYQHDKACSRCFCCARIWSTYI